MAKKGELNNKKINENKTKHISTEVFKRRLVDLPAKDWEYIDDIANQMSEVRGHKVTSQDIMRNEVTNLVVRWGYRQRKKLKEIRRIHD